MARAAQGLTREGACRFMRSREGELPARGGPGGEGEGRPQVRQLMMVAVAAGVPFVGFGVCDNAIMILAGDTIEKSVGVRLGLSAMAAAGLGNLCSDVAGIGLADYIELLCLKMGVPIPTLSREQLMLAETRAAKTAGACLGVSLGCLIGMFPLLVI